MTTIQKHQYEQFYDGDRKKFDIEVHIEADSISTDYDETTLEAVNRVKQAIRNEAQKIQDEMD